MDPMDEMRAGDADRERVVEQLREHGAAGRLSVDELEARIEEAYAAKTFAELRTVLRELPDEPAAAGESAKRERPRGRSSRDWARAPFALAAVPLLLLAGVVAAIVLSGGHLWWLVFPAWAVLAKGGHGHGWGCGTRHHRHARRREPDSIVV